MAQYSRVITTKAGATCVLLVFAGVLAGGISGCTQIYKDFKLEWFFPDDSYVNVFFQENAKYFASGTPFTVYVRDIDYYKSQSDLVKLFDYVNSSKTVESTESGDWLHTFLEFAADQDEWSSEMDAETGLFTDEDAFYARLHEWYRSGGGRRFQTSMNWNDGDCENSDIVPSTTVSQAADEKCPAPAVNECNDEVRVWDSCDVKKGLSSTRFDATFKLEFTDKGEDRYNTMDTMRKGVNDIVSGSFPYSFEFLYWEEVGIIDQELIRNLAICGAVVLIMIGLMIPNVRISIWVALSICLSVIDLVGFMFYWDITISGVSTIYILISVGLTVDYSAHIAHMFVISTGTAPERAQKALTRLGPSVFNAIVSTLLAVCVIGGSKSYVFRIFFQALFLTVILGGAHGMMFLPAILSLVGGDNFAPEDSPRGVKKNAVADEEIEMGKYPANGKNNDGVVPQEDTKTESVGVEEKADPEQIVV